MRKVLVEVKQEMAQHTVNFFFSLIALFLLYEVDSTLFAKELFIFKWEINDVVLHTISSSSVLFIDFFQVFQGFGS